MSEPRNDIFRQAGVASFDSLVERLSAGDFRLHRVPSPLGREVSVSDEPP